MFLTNHVMTATALALVIDDPVILAPAAFGSHFVLDSIPHYGFPPGTGMKSDLFKRTALLDAVIAATVSLTAATLVPQRAPQILLAGFSACLPDLLYIPRYGMNIKFWEPLFRFHSRIQWFQKAEGAVVELGWGILMTTIVGRLI
jgi:hypothetical protein